ncbi:MAG: hypothetical protein SWQ30_16505, partial [Thermodesulfobacteriota bacterium]|nr:hypothetical protein [Thermodesulfobacteriota bacterium]
EPLTTQEMRYHRLSLRVNNMAGFLLFVDVTGSPFDNIAQKTAQRKTINAFWDLLPCCLCNIRVYSSCFESLGGDGDACR